MASYLIAGGSKGLGLEAARQLLSQDASVVSHIFITIRDPNNLEVKNLSELHGQRLTVLANCDIRDDASVTDTVSEVKSKLGGKGLDVLINNAGVVVFSMHGIAGTSSEAFLDLLNVNVVGAHRFIVACLPLLREGKLKKVINITSSLGSFGWKDYFGYVPSAPYKCTKAALNMLTVQSSAELSKDGIQVLSISPGWVKTEGGTLNADLEPDVAVRAMLERIQSAGKEENGQWLNTHVKGWEDKSQDHRYDGGNVPW